MVCADCVKNFRVFSYFMEILRNKNVISASLNKTREILLSKIYCFALGFWIRQISRKSNFLLV